MVDLPWRTGRPRTVYLPAYFVRAVAEGCSARIWELEKPGCTCSLNGIEVVTEDHVEIAGQPPLTAILARTDAQHLLERPDRHVRCVVHTGSGQQCAVMVRNAGGFCVLNTRAEITRSLYLRRRK